jgi:monoamine oxidase
MRRKIMTHNDVVLEQLAREVLMLDESGQSLIPKYESIIEKGIPNQLPPDAKRKDVLIIGAGMAGLLAGKILKDTGYNITILEANDNRLGGRIKTFRTSPEGDYGFSDPKQYGEAGAMRIPTTHPLVNKLIDTLNLRSKAQFFYNIDVSKDDPNEQAYHTWLKTNARQNRRIEYNTSMHPAEDTGFQIPPEYAEKSAAQLLTQALSTVNKLIDPTQSIDKQINGWKEIIRQYDSYSMYHFLRDEANFPEQVIDYIGTLQNLTSRMFISFFHSFVDTFYINPQTKYLELDGGLWQLPYTLSESLKENIVMDARAIEIQWSDPHTEKQGSKAIHRGSTGVYVRTINEPIIKHGVARPGRVRVEREFTADYLIVTIPFSALRFVSVNPEFRYEKRRAIMELHYDSATKIFLEFNERFWEWNEEEWRNHLGDEYRGHDAYGGGSITDTPNRFIYYPSHKVEGSRGAVILASYTWADEANRWDSIPLEDRYNFALKGLTDIYGKGIKKFFTGVGKSESWMQDYYAYGEAAVFTPGQLTALHPHIPTPEGPVHFAGEHTSLKHAWIEGAIESAIRVALEIHDGN